MSDIGAGGKGLPIPANANQIAMAAGPNATERTQAEFQALPVRAPNTVDEQFPTAGLQSSDARDPMMKTKMELEAVGRANQQASNVTAPLPGATPLGLMVAQDSDFQRLIDIREKELEKQFEQWFATNFDKMDPTHKAMARKLYEKFYNDRLRNLDTNLEMTRRLARSKITGIQTKEDLKLAYAAESGMIDTDYLENLLHPEKVARNQQEAARQAAFVRGIFNPKRFVRGDWGPNQRPDNSKKILNRTAASPAALFGVDGNPFSVIGDVSSAQERNTGASAILPNLQ